MKSSISRILAIMANPTVFIALVCCAGGNGQIPGCNLLSRSDNGIAETGTPETMLPAESAMAVVEEPHIIDRPVLFDSVRLALTREYACMHYGTDDIIIVPQMIIIHWTASSSLESAFNEFNRREIAGREHLRKQGRVNVAVHFLVDRDGTIYRLMPETLMGRHAIGLNHCAIGVENVGYQDLTDEQLYANADLIRYLVREHAKIRYLIGHAEYGKFRGSRLFIELAQGYFIQAGDPDAEFIKRLRVLVADLRLDSLPDELNSVIPLSIYYGTALVGVSREAPLTDVSIYMTPSGLVVV